MSSHIRFLMALSSRVAPRGYLTASLQHGLPTLTIADSSSYRFITSRAARVILGLPAKVSSSEATPLTLKELRHAYFAAAKRCHPDVKSEEEDTNSGDSEGGDHAFLEITRAYELLQGEITKNEDLLVSTISSSEEAEFRHACRTQLGVEAEIVEECKQNPIFRQWLMGRTDSAHHWRTFFLQQGGLAPKLRPSGGHLAAGSSPVPSHSTRRKRK